MCQSVVQRAASRRVVCLCLHDWVLGVPGADADVPVPRHGEVPRDPLAHDEFGFCALWTFFYFAAALAAAVEGPHSSALGTS